MCHASDAVSGSASQSSSANDISSMSTEHTLASDTDSSSIDTLTGPLDESQWTQPHFSFTVSRYQSVTTFLSSLYSFPFPVWIFFLPYPELTSMNRSIFLFSFPVWSGGSCWSSSSSNFVSDCCLEVKAICAISWVKGFSLPFLVDISNVKLYASVLIFRSPGEGGGLMGFFSLYACILIVLFF